MDETAFFTHDAKGSRSRGPIVRYRRSEIEFHLTPREALMTAHQALQLVVLRFGIIVFHVFSGFQSVRQIFLKR